jgi:hypothetical protein
LAKEGKREKGLEERGNSKEEKKEKAYIDQTRSMRS